MTKSASTRALPSAFEHGKRGPCQLYLASPLDVGGPSRSFAEALRGGAGGGVPVPGEGIDQRGGAPAEPLAGAAAPHARSPSSSMTTWVRRSGSAPTASYLSGRRRSARRGRCSAPRADRNHLPRQPPPRHGGGRGGRRLCRLRRLLSHRHQGDAASPRSVRSSAGGQPCSRSCVAIGGITPENGRVLVEAGADFSPCAARSGEREGRGAVKAFQEILSADISPPACAGGLRGGDARFSNPPPLRPLRTREGGS